MKFFTEAFLCGDVDETAVLDEYRRYLRSLGPQSPAGQFGLSVSLSDGLLDRLTFSPGSLRLLVTTGDLQIGYSHTELVYRGGRVVEGENLLHEALRIRPTEIWFDEFTGEPASHHRFLLADRNGAPIPIGEFQIDFDDLSVSQTPARGRRLRSLEDKSNWP